MIVGLGFRWVLCPEKFFNCYVTCVFSLPARHYCSHCAQQESGTLPDLAFTPLPSLFLELLPLPLLSPLLACPLLPTTAVPVNSHSYSPLISFPHQVSPHLISIQIHGNEIPRPLGGHYCMNISVPLSRKIPIAFIRYNIVGKRRRVAQPQSGMSQLQSASRHASRNRE